MFVGRGKEKKGEQEPRKERKGWPTYNVLSFSLSCFIFLLFSLHSERSVCWALLFSPLQQQAATAAAASFLNVSSFSTIYYYYYTTCTIRVILLSFFLSFFLVVPFLFFFSGWKQTRNKWVRVVPDAPLERWPAVNLLCILHVLLKNYHMVLSFFLSFHSITHVYRK